MCEHKIEINKQLNKDKVLLWLGTIFDQDIFVDVSKVNKERKMGKFETDIEKSEEEVPVEKMCEYKVVVHNDLSMFMDMIAHFLRKGWNCAGGVSIEDTAFGYRYYQAMTFGK